jgi:adenine phosphoribosyltransferase
MLDLRNFIRDVPDFPKPGILFKDITPLLRDAQALAECVVQLAAPFRNQKIAAVCSVEARGFIFGAALAHALGIGFVPIRKAGKLPGVVVGVNYALEYGEDRLETIADALAPGDRVVLIDDVLATGGTLLAARELILGFDAELVAAAVLIELKFLNGRSRWPAATPLHSLLCY